LQLINACPTPLGWDYDPLAAVRAANHLRALGKDKAIDALREFASIACDDGYGGFDRVDPENIDTSNQWCLSTPLPLVFESADPRGEESRLREESITVRDGIPFHNVRIDATSGWPAHTAPYVEWAAQHGKLIASPLRPTDHPLEAADARLKELFESRK